MDEAWKEYCSIFKSKTGNELGKPFERKPKKYMVVKMNYKNIDFKDYLIPFSKLPEDTTKKSELPARVRDLLIAITDSTSIAKAMNHFGIDTNLLNPSNIDKKLIEEARDYLHQIKDSIEALNTLQTEQYEKKKEIDFEHVSEIKDKIADLSSRFYELIPHF